MCNEDYRRIGLVVAFFFCVGSGQANELDWVNTEELKTLLNATDQVKFPAANFLSKDEFLCAAGSYAFGLQNGFEDAENDLKQRNLLPVEEGDGLIFSLDYDRRLKDIAVISVWPEELMLDVDEPVCLATFEAQIDIRREGKSLIIELETKS